MSAPEARAEAVVRPEDVPLPGGDVPDPEEEATPPTPDVEDATAALASASVTSVARDEDGATKECFLVCLF
jgi:hypothetical protein